MEKTNQKSYIPSVNVSLRHILTLPTVVSLVLFAILFLYSTCFEQGFYETDYYTLFDCLREEASSSDPYYYYFSVSYTNPLMTAFLGVVLGIFQFNFLLNKKSCLTHLSFPLKRSRLYLYRTLFPLIIAIWIISVVAIAVAILNVIYIGFSIVLLKALFAKIILNILPLIFCFTVTVAAHLFTSRKIEAYTLILSLLLSPFSIQKLVRNLFTVTLFGFGNDFYLYNTQIDDVLSKFDPLGMSLALEDSLDYVSKNEPLHILSIIWGYIILLVVCVAALVLFGLYFSKKFKPEASGIKGKSRITHTLLSVPVPLLTSAYSMEVLLFDYTNTAVFSASKVISYVIISVIVGVIASVIINFIVSLGVKKFVWGLSGAGIVAVANIIIVIIGFTGCFGFSSYIPEADDILYIDISLPFDDFCNNRDNNFLEGSTDADTLFVWNENDFDTICQIHKSIIDTKDLKETAINCKVTYTLKNGKTVTRNFYNISEQASYQYLSLWETETVNYNYKYILGQNTAEDTEELREYIEEYLSSDYGAYSNSISNYEDSSYQSVYDYYYFSGYYYDMPSQISFTDNIFIISKDNTVTNIGKITDMDVSRPYLADNIELITEALYKDICTLSAEEWFMPERQLGAIVFSAFHSNSYNYKAKDLLLSTNNVFYINSNMTNTLKVLDQLGYSKYFECTKQIHSAHLVDVNHMVNWAGSLLVQEEQYTESLLHSTYFTQNSQEMYDYLEYISSTTYESEQPETQTVYSSVSFFDRLFGNNYYENYSYGDSLPPPKTPVTDNVHAQDMLNNSYMAYNVGNNGDFLVVQFTDGSYCMLIKPS